jgi:uncharacterized membrane protein
MSEHAPRHSPGPERLGGFSDGVIAVIITIMVLELHVPHAPTAAALLALWPTFASYLLSYLFVAIIWVNHHHLVHYTREATPRAVWTNLLMLFFVSLIPFFTEWVADSRLAPFATAMYAADFLTVCGTFILFENSVAAQLDPADRELAATRARANRRNWVAFGLYALAIPAAFWEPVLSLGIILSNALMYIVPESRMLTGRKVSKSK